MFNLLPENIKNKIRKEYFLRRVMVVFMFLIFIGAAFLIFLFPSWIVSVYKERGLSSQAESTNQSSLIAEMKEITSDVNKINAELKTIDESLEYKKIVPFINIILSKRARSIYINELTYTSDGPKKATIKLEGISSTRVSLLSFVKSLEETKSFKVVDLPISNFAKDRNINFSISLTIEP